LRSLKVEPPGQNGRKSPLLESGQRTTLIFAKNGSGKTPIIRSLPAGLGFPPKFRDEIFGKCAAVTLEADNDGNGHPASVRLVPFWRYHLGQTLFRKMLMCIIFGWGCSETLRDEVGGSHRTVH